MTTMQLAFEPRDAWHRLRVIRRGRRWTAAVVLITSALVIASACGDPSGRPPPVGPTGPEVTELVAGRWQGTLRLTEVRTNTNRNYVPSCVRALPQFTVGRVTPVTLEVAGTGETQEQFGGTASGVSAKLANLLTGSSCELHGWILPAVKWSASLFANQCDPDVLAVQCDTGEVRELRMRNNYVAVQLRVAGSSATGSVSDDWLVFIPGNGIEEDALYFSSDLSVSRE